MLTDTGPASSEPERWVGVQSSLACLLQFPQRKLLDLNQRSGRMNLAGPRKAGDGRVRESCFSGQERARRPSSGCVLRLEGLSNSLREVSHGKPHDAQVTSPCNPHSVDSPGGALFTPHGLAQDLLSVACCFSEDRWDIAAVQSQNSQRLAGCSHQPSLAQPSLLSLP